MIEPMVAVGLARKQAELEAKSGELLTDSSAAAVNARRMFEEGWRAYGCAVGGSYGADIYKNDTYIVWFLEGSTYYEEDEGAANEFRRESFVGADSRESADDEGSYDFYNVEVVSFLETLSDWCVPSAERPRRKRHFQNPLY